jgi:hypothetical protein
LSQATTTVSTYYADINARAYSQAYNIWGSAYRKTTSSYQFYTGYADTQSDKLQLGTATQLSDGTVKVPVTVTATVSSSGGPAVNTYQGYYIVGLEDGQPHLLSADLQLTNSSSNSVKQAVSLLEQYYADINARAYSQAYDIWGSAYHKTTSSYQFYTGYASTKSVSIAIHSEGITVLNDGTVRVPLTITSVTNTSSGNTTHTYSGYYIIGVENGAWHLLSANIH